MLRDVPTPVSFFCCDRLHTCVFVCVSSRCGVSYRFLHLLSGQTVIGCILKKGQEGLDVEPKREPPVVCEPDWRASRSIAPGRDGHTVFGVPIEWTNAPCVPVCSANFFPEMFGWSDSVLFGTRADNNDSVAPSQGVMFLRAWRSRTGHFSGFVVSNSPMRPY